MARKRLTSMPIEFQLCRGPGRHQWELSTPPPGNKKGTSFGYLLFWQCVRCGGTRYDTYNSLGRLGQRSYDMPDGYHFARDEAPSTADIVLSLTLEYQLEFNGIEPAEKRAAEKPAPAKRPKKAVAKRAKPRPKKRSHLRAVS